VGLERQEALSDRAWRLALLTTAAVALAAFAGLLELGMDAGRAAGAVILCLAALIPCAVLVGAVCAACRVRCAWPLQLGAAGAIAVAIAATVIQVRGAGGDEVVETDRAGRILTR
jgi:hypothetical protein